MAQIVRQSYGLCKVLVEAKRPRYRARYLCDFECVREARPGVVALREKKYLRLVFEAPE
jgi:hypothetical protein